MAEDNYQLVHAFINQNPNFVLGFESGRFYDSCISKGTMGRPLSSGEVSEEVLLKGTYHTANEGELLRIADYHGLSRTYWEITDDPNWATAGFKRKEVE